MCRMEKIPRPARTTTIPFVNSTVATVRTPLMCAGSSITGCGKLGCGILGCIGDRIFSGSPRRGKPRLYTSFSAILKSAGDAGTQLLDDIQSGFVGCFALSDLEGDCAD